MTNYVKCGQCVAAGDSSKKDVFVVVDDNKVSLRCANHGGKGKVFIKPLKEHYPNTEE